MAEIKEKIPEFKKTISPEAVIGEVKSGWYCDLTLPFDEYPIISVRRAILKYWLERPIEVRDYQADWIETRVRDLKEEENRIDRLNFWKELLDWYIFNTHGKLASRALDFAVEITKTADFSLHMYSSDILKLIAGRLDRSPEIYQDLKTPTLRLFLESFLVQACQPNSTIFDFTMVDIKRVINSAVKVEDWRFLPLIEQVLYKLCNQKSPERYDFKQEYEIQSNIAFLRVAVRLFREKTEETKDA